MPSSQLAILIWPPLLTPPPSHSPAPSSSPPLQVEMVSHYGNEHYCPISVFRVIGASLVEEFEYSEARKTIIVAASSDDESGERV